VEKCLNSFDNVHEWADCIAFLKQLLKVGQFDVSSGLLKEYSQDEVDLPIVHAIQGDSTQAYRR
jgi:Dopey, N-terminal